MMKVESVKSQGNRLSIVKDALETVKSTQPVTVMKIEIGPEDFLRNTKD
jgi:hypothetical protein